MTSRERVWAAFSHQEPDRTPFWEKLIKSPVADELLGRPSVAANFHYRMERLADGDWPGLIEQWARDEIELAEILGFDMIRLYEVSGPPAHKPIRVDKNTWRLGDTMYQRLDSGWIKSWTISEEPAVAPKEAAQEAYWRRILQQPSPEPPVLPPESFQLIRAARRIMAEKRLDLPIFCAVYGLGISTLPKFMLEWFVTERKLLAEYFRRQAHAGLQRAKQFVAEGAEIIGLGGDFASDHGPLCCPADYREFVALNIRKQARALHQLGALVTNASDGNLWPVLDDFLVTSEVDGFEEIDFAAGMDLGRLKQTYPDKTFIGNMDIRWLLTSGTPQQVQAHTIECLQKGWGQGGHILMSSNCIHENVKTELFLAYVNAYRCYFGLPLL